MRLDANLANGDPTLAALVPDGVTLADILTMFQDAYRVNGEQLLRHRLGATHPANLALPDLAEFIIWLLRALKSASIGDPAAELAHGVQRRADAAAAKLASSPEIGITAQAKSGPSPVKLENSPAGTSAASPPLAQTAHETTKAEEERQPDQPATSTTPQTIANPEVTNPEAANARDEIIIDGRRRLSERRVAKMLGCSLRTLQRRRKEGKGPLSTKIVRKVYYELDDLQGWIDGGKIR